MTKKPLILGCFLLLLALPLSAGDAIPVLCYHGFTDDSVSTRGALTITFGQFEAMLRFLAHEGYVSCFPNEVESGAGGSGKRVILTFDDGSRDHLRAAELMQKFGFKGIFFVIPHRVEAGSTRSMTAEDLRLLAASGHRIAAHGYRHEMMPESPDEVTASLERSPSVLRRIAGPGYDGEDFAFPFGHYDAGTVAALSGTFRFLHTVNPGYWDGISPVIPRMVVTTDEDTSFFQEYVTGASAFRPTLTLVTGDGTVSPLVEFHNGDTTRLGAVEMMSVSPDLTGRLYTRHTLDSNITIDGSRVLINLRNHMQRYYAPDRRIIAYALLTESGGALHFLSTGQTHWIEEPLSTSHQPLTPLRNTYAH
jgi:peptidoglycan/xylan/chitin deacetylase (PgdA/CDA1 family)